MKFLIALTLSVLSVVAQNPISPRFPAGVATDRDLTVATNGASSLLTATIDGSTLSVPVDDASQFLLWSVVTIEGEKMQVCGKSGNTLQMCARGWAGTPVGTHRAGRSVDVFVEGLSFDAIAAELKSIEAALGVNMANIPGVGYSAENSANKDATATLGTSDVKYPTQKAVKTYVDNAKAGTVGDPGANGVVKRTAPGVTAPAVAGTDYYAPGGTIASTDLPNPQSAAGGKVQAKDCTGMGHILKINTDSTVVCSADAGASGGLGDPGGSGIVKRTAPATTIPAVAGTDYYAPGTAIASTDLPNPQASAGGKVQAKDCTGTGHVLKINTDSTVTCSADVASSALQDPGGNGIVKRTAPNTSVAATAGTDYYAPGGTIASADLPNPGASAGGKVQAKDCTGTGHILKINTDSTVVCSSDAGLGALQDPGGNGIVKRTSSGVSAPAVAGTDYVGVSDSRLSDSRTPTTHASTHQAGGSDEVATTTPASGAIPKAGTGGTLGAGWIPGSFVRNDQNNSYGAFADTHVDIATPGPPPGLSTKVYTSAGRLCSLDSGSHEYCTGPSGGGGGSGASQTSQLLDFAFTRASATQLTFGSGCTASTPCNVDIAGQVTSFTGGPYTINMGGSSTGSICVYVVAPNVLTVGVSTSLGANISGSGTLTFVQGVNSCPSDSKKLETWAATSGAWASTGTSLAAAYSYQPKAQSGTGVNVTPGAGVGDTIAIDTSVTLRKFVCPSGPATTLPPNTATLGDICWDFNPSTPKGYACSNAAGCAVAADWKAFN